VGNESPASSGNNGADDTDRITEKGKALTEKSLSQTPRSPSARLDDSSDSDVTTKGHPSETESIDAASFAANDNNSAAAPISKEDTIVDSNSGIRSNPEMEQRETDIATPPPLAEQTAEIDESAVKRIVIKPSAVHLKPGEIATFEIEAETEESPLGKVTNAQWTVQGGEISALGVYVAGNAAGEYTITAKAGTYSATAQVTIDVPKPIWKVLEPEDQSDPVPHETYDMWMRDKDWRVIAASVRGKLHAHKALWRDDAYSVDWVDGWTIIAVGDGAGSAKLSRIGSRVACAAAVTSLKGLLEDFEIGRRGNEVPKENDLQKLKSFLVMAASEARNEIVREAHNRECNLKDLSTTLLLAVHAHWKKKHLIASIQVGDGAIGIFQNSGECTVLGVADHGEFSSETVFLTTGSELVKKPLDQRVLFSLKPDVQCIGVMCDGVSDDFFPEEKNLVKLFNGDPIEELQTTDGGAVRGIMYSVAPNPQDGKTLLEWLKYEKKGSSDDRTLVLLYRR